MKVVIAHRSGAPKVVELPEPSGGRNFVTVRVSHSALTLPAELDIVERVAEHLKKGEDGVPLGSCASGTVMQVGEDVRRIKAGVRVAVTGKPYVYHSSHLVVPENLVVELPKKVNQEEGAYAGQGAAALHTFRTSCLQLGETALIFGADMPGFLIAQIARAAGVVPVLVDESEFRLKKAQTLGVLNTQTPDEEQLIRLIDTLTAGAGIDAAFITRPDDVPSLMAAMQLLRDGGTLVLCASMHSPVPLEAVTRKSLRVVTARDGGPGSGDREYELGGFDFPRSVARWTQRDNMDCFCQLLSDRKVQVSPLVTERLPIERAPLAYEKARRSRDAAIGVVFTV